VAVTCCVVDGTIPVLMGPDRWVGRSSMSVGFQQDTEYRGIIRLDLTVIAGNGLPQRSPSIAVAGVGICAVSQQHLNHGVEVPVNGKVQRTRAAGIRVTYVSTATDQGKRCDWMAVEEREHERGGHIPGAPIDVGAILEEDLDETEITVYSRHAER